MNLDELNFEEVNNNSKNRYGFTGYADPVITVYPFSKTRVIFFSKVAKETFGLRPADDFGRPGTGVGFIKSPQQKRLLFIYFTDEYVHGTNTAEVRKYRKSPIRVHSKLFIKMIMDNFSMKMVKNKSHKVKILAKSPIVKTISGVPRECFLVYDVAEHRFDLTEEERIAYNKELTELYQSITK